MVRKARPFKIDNFGLTYWVYKILFYEFLDPCFNGRASSLPQFGAPKARHSRSLLLLTSYSGLLKIRTRMWSDFDESPDFLDKSFFVKIQKSGFFEEFNLNQSVLATYTLSATKLNVRPRFEPQILHCQSFMDFRTVEVQKFRAQKFEQLGTRIRFSQSCFNLAKNDFYTSYLHHID